jgi:hypothetical protein
MPTEPPPAGIAPNSPLQLPVVTSTAGRTTGTNDAERRAVNNRIPPEKGT